jgi:hypothetical protein
VIPRVSKATYIKDFRIMVLFADGVEGEVNLSDELEGEIFQPLKNVEYFKKFIVHPELHTLTWPNGADFAPEFLYDKIKVPA